MKVAEISLGTAIPGHHAMIDRFNPILVREARMMVRSRWITWLIMVYQVILIVMLGFLAIRLSENMSLEEAAVALYHSVSMTTWNMTVLAVVTYTGWRMAADRINEDLSFCTTITPSQNIRGRLACGFVLSVLFYSMSAPYLSVTYLLRGIDLWPFLYWLPVQLVKVTILNLVAVAIFSAVRSWLQLFFYALLFLPLAETLGQLSQIGTALLFYGPHIFGTSYWPLDFYGYTHVVTINPTTFVALGVLALILVPVVTITAFLFARCNLSPYLTNRMMPIRRWLSWLLGGSFLIALLATLIQYGSPGSFPILSVWLAIAVGILSAMLILAVCERETWEGRLRRSIPESRFRRALVFPLFTGSVNGLLWVFLWTFFLVLVISATVLLQMNSFDASRYGSYTVTQEFLLLFRHLVFLMLVFDYSMTAFFLWKVLLRRWVPREMIWTLTLGLMAAAATGSYLAAFFVQENFQVADELALLAPNPVSVYTADDFGYQLVFGLGWFCAIILFGYPWLRNRFLDFTPSGAPDFFNAKSTNQEWNS